MYTVCVYGQQALIDSLYRAYLGSADLTQKADLYYQLAEEVSENDLEAAFTYADTLELIARKNNNLQGLARAEFLRGDAYRQKAEYNLALHHFNLDLAYRLKNADSMGLAKVYSNIAAVYKDRAMGDSAIYYHLLSIKINEAKSEWKSIAASYANIGNLYGDLALPERALEYLKKALNIRLEHGDEKGAIYTYNNLSIAYEGIGDYATALQQAQLGVALAEKYNNKFAAGVIYGSIGHLLHKLERNQEAILYNERSVEYLTSLNRKANVVYPMVNLAMAYNALGQPHQALQYARQGYAIMEELQLIDPMQIYYDEFAKAYEQIGDYREANRWLKKYMVLNDSLFNAEKIKNVADLETKYQTQKKETELAQQKLQLQDQGHKLFRQRALILGLLIGMGLLVVASVFYLQRLRLRKKMELDAAVIKEQKLGLKAVIEAQEAERSRMAKELHDGVAQELLAVKLGLQRLQLNTNLEDKHTLQQLTALLDESCQEVRQISHEMLPPLLVKEGLVPSLQALLEKSLRHAGVHFEFASPDLPNLDAKVSLSIYRIVQELISNILKHSEANEVFMAISLAGENLELQLKDNGKGFALDEGLHKDGLGLWNIFSQVSTLGGHFKSEPNTPSGTVATLSIPLA